MNQLGYNPYTGQVGQALTAPPASTVMTPDQLQGLCEKGKTLGKVYAEQGYQAAYAEAQKWAAEAPQFAGLAQDPKVMDYLAQCMLEGYYQARKAKEGGDMKAYAIGGGVGVVLGLLGGWAIAKYA